MTGIHTCKRVARAALLTALLSAWLAGCAQPVTPVRIGTNPWPGYEFLHLAEELGYFREEGARVELVEFLSLGDSSRAFERGQIDAWGTTLAELLLVHEHSRREAQAFLVTNTSTGGDMLLARPGIASLPALKGKRVGAEPATVDMVLLHHALQSAGLRVSDVQVVSMPQNKLLGALARGQIDAAVSYGPTAVELQRKARAVRLFDSTKVSDKIVDVLAAERNLLAARGDEFAAVARAYFRARAYAQTNPVDAHARMARRQGLTVAEFRDVLNGLALSPADAQASYLAPDGHLVLALRETAAALRDAGLPLAARDPATLRTDRALSRASGK